MKIYELIPQDGRKSFYGKAVVHIAEDGSETLYSYNTPHYKADCFRRTGKTVGRLDSYHGKTHFCILRIE